jgi:KUP system potassium uptake protein
MERNQDQKHFLPLSLAALGVVYGDIGTSPLYAMRESLRGLVINLPDILGILSLIFWSLILIISVKYLLIVFRADNDGEGGILALLALLKRLGGKSYKMFFVIGIFGGGLMMGDGMLTPAISVMSAVEGLNIVSPTTSEFIIPLAFVILFFLFFFQSYGTAKIGYSFGPIILVWFGTIGVLGIHQIIQNPIVLKAMNPLYAADFFYHTGWKGYALLGGIFLVVTGGEALYADLGHFGKNPIRLGWFFVALPGLLLNYFGQGAFLLSHPTAINNPFYSMAPAGLTLPLVIIATMATVIASQAVISATFSLTKQAVLLGLYPHLPIIQTSASERGQIYVPQMNFILGIGTLLLIIIFRSSSAMTHAYGVAVNLVMILVTLMVIYAAHHVWRWSFFKIALIFPIFLFIDLAFLGANVQKIHTGGWVPIAFALGCGFVMYTWSSGMKYLRESYYTKKEDLVKVLGQLNYETLNHLKDTTAIFITDIYDQSGGSFLHFLKLSRAVPENILILSYVVESIPYVQIAHRFESACLGRNVYQVTLHYGFMDFIDIPRALKYANKNQLFSFPLSVDSATYFVEIPNIMASRLKKRSFLFYWQEKLFAFLMRNYSANLNIEFYHLPYNRTIAIGAYCII